MTLKRTDSTDPDFISLVRLLDAELAERDGADHAFYAQFNKIDLIRNAIVATVDGEAAGCGAFKIFDAQTVEVKRMFTLPERRGMGLAAAVLTELESWAAELGFARAVLETGEKQPEAIALYLKSGYRRIANYGQYAGVENSLCFEKTLAGG